MTMTMTDDQQKNNDQYGFRFREWDIYQDARAFRKQVNELLKHYPKEERFELVGQAKRALNSIVLNIAEGSNKSTDKDARIYINRAHGSLDEVVGCLDCSLDDGYISREEHAEILAKASSLAKRIRGFTKHLKDSASSLS